MASLPRHLASETIVSPPADWEAIRDADCPLVLEPRDLAGLEALSEGLASTAPFELRAEGAVAEAVAGLGDLPLQLRQDIQRLANRFAALMAVPTVRIRLEGVVSNACRKIHSDNTDVRLITTYCGPGTDYIPRDMEPEERNLQRIPTGWVALFKGRSFDPAHAFCLHRSPPAADMDVARLVLVIDTPLKPELAALLRGQHQAEPTKP
ncbi:DUF1826 domain-containing protein [Altererythrobacter sp. KTW20L]|uniref:DUF1826 domain-containing protein n=1 Tax=Altererythrobacter sp. KTW20L TaxID=2942210 RepID=UPI0020BFBDF9|nr:DUF1826 domain-containing protein [Altererythrobacter sp. KTW20L]MCL6250578.1 DUF1826 domain-containing protein [Altererythrobacter sp. KTW20L]